MRPILMDFQNDNFPWLEKFSCFIGAALFSVKSYHPCALRLPNYFVNFDLHSPSISSQRVQNITLQSSEGNPPVTIHAYEITFSLVNENIACYFYGFLLHVQLVNERIYYSHGGGTNPFMNENVSRPTGTQPYSFITKEQWGKGKKDIGENIGKSGFLYSKHFPFGYNMYPTPCSNPYVLLLEC